MGIFYTPKIANVKICLLDVKICLPVFGIKGWKYFAFCGIINSQVTQVGSSTGLFPQLRLWFVTSLFSLLWVCHLRERVADSVFAQPSIFFSRNNRVRRLVLPPSKSPRPIIAHGLSCAGRVSFVPVCFFPLGCGGVKQISVCGAGQ